MTENVKKYLLISSFLVLIILLILGINVFKIKPNTLGKVINEFNEIDKKYNGDWRNERIKFENELGNASLMPLKNIDKAIEELRDLEKEIKEQNLTEKTELSTIGDILVNLTQARILMLEAEKAFHEAENIGDKGKINFYMTGVQALMNETVDCRDKPLLMKTINLLNQTITLANEAKTKIDFVMQNYIPARKQLGASSATRIQFYDSLLGDIVLQIKINELVVYQYCKNF